MIRTGPGSHGWLVSLADLSLILFIVTSGAIANDPLPQAQGSAEPSELPATGVASSVYLDGPGAPALADFLARHAVADGEQLTIAGVFGPGGRPAVAQRVEALAAEATANGIEPRVILQPGPRRAISVAFSHDADAQMAQGLRDREDE